MNDKQKALLHEMYGKQYEELESGVPASIEKRIDEMLKTLDNAETVEDLLNFDGEIQ